MQFALTRRHLLQTAPALAAAVTTPALMTPFPARAQDGSSTAPLIVDDAGTANPDLVPSELQIPDGFDVAPQTVNLPEGFAIAVLAAGLTSPRFMAVDAAGNLLVADASAGNVYRYPVTDNAIAPAATPPEPLLTGLNEPSNVALFADDGIDLPLHRRDQPDQSRPL